MKKIFIYMTSALAMVALVSCSHLNDEPKFDDADSFVAFGKVSVSCNEADGQIKIPVNAASLSGKETTISFETVDGTAKAGTDFKISGASTLSFNAENRVNYIAIDIIEHDGQFTGDLKFQVKITSGGDMAVGADNVCDITISDNDHPLSFILGDYVFSGIKYPANPTSWTVTIFKDPEDVSVVWFYDLMGNPSWAGDDIVYYGVVSEDKTKITIPLGQESEYVYSNGNPVTLFGLASDLEGYDSGNIEVEIKEDGKVLDFGTTYGMWFYIEDAGGIGTYLPGITAVRK